jgi:hypothetical protein
MQAAQPRLMEHVASFLLASGPRWSSTPPTRLWSPHSHLYSSPRTFPVESHLLLGCSHKILNRAGVTLKLCCRDAAVHSMALGLSRCSIVASNTILASAHKVRQGMYCPMLHLDSSQMVWQPYQDTICTSSAMSLYVIGSTGTSAAGLMTPFQSLSFSGGSGNSTLGQIVCRHSVPVGR